MWVEPVTHSSKDLNLKIGPVKLRKDLGEPQVHYHAIIFNLCILNECDEFCSSNVSKRVNNTPQQWFAKSSWNTVDNTLTIEECDEHRFDL
ncbi:hypothetical protein CEXT_662081 [Caerostris extrusa]|uniref:Uncharacterized protein n=1 Tax=Caerostris extrusa TaxID=172846 RepID=A0AAV4PWS5_CAEEX|nr:hypothetical protein CEXT_662081 [Caerostris extrusa]